MKIFTLLPALSLPNDILTFAPETVLLGDYGVSVFDDTQDVVAEAQLATQSHQQPADRIPAGIRRAAPVASLAELAADFWPEEETADDINDYIAQQRTADRTSDL